MPEYPLELQNVTKTFGGFTAVKDVSFALAAGEIIGFLGPNGAGKSTSLRLALGILAPRLACSQQHIHARRVWRFSLGVQIGPVQAVEGCRLGVGHNWMQLFSRSPRKVGR